MSHESGVRGHRKPYVVGQSEDPQVVGKQRMSGRPKELQDIKDGEHLRGQSQRMLRTLQDQGIVGVAGQGE